MCTETNWNYYCGRCHHYIRTIMTVSECSVAKDPKQAPCLAKPTVQSERKFVDSKECRSCDELRQGAKRKRCNVTSDDEQTQVA